jgi:hypothetical protein
VCVCVCVGYSIGLIGPKGGGNGECQGASNHSLLVKTKEDNS